MDSVTTPQKQQGTVNNPTKTSSTQHTGEESSSTYPSGCRLELRSHRPPLPFGGLEYKLNRPEILPPSPEESENQEDYVFRGCGVPLTAETPSHEEKLEIVIRKKVSSGKLAGAQTFTCEIADDEHKVRFVKIYDPLYYPWSDEWGNRNNTIFMADRDYSREAAAYNCLSQKGQNGTLAPKYYGSWTISLEGPQRTTRPVRLILLEYIPAPSLLQEYYPKTETRWGFDNPNRTSSIPAGFQDFGDFEEFRIEVYGCLLEIRAKQLHMGLNQGDLAPRNVLAVLEKSEHEYSKSRLRRVVLVDYNVSIVIPLSNLPIPAPERLPYNPLRRNWNGLMLEFAGWLPEAWLKNKDLYREWLYTRFGVTDRGKEYMPLSPDFLQTLDLWRESRGLEELPEHLTRLEL